MWHKHTVHEGQRIKALEENIAEDEPNERQNEENIVNANKYRSRTEKSIFIGFHQNLIRKKVAYMKAVLLLAE